MLSLARALGRDPKVLLADELSLGLAPIIVANLLQAVRAAADERGVGVLLVEQHVRQALAIADRVYVMERGRIVLSGTADEVAGQLDKIEAAYLPPASEPAPRRQGGGDHGGRRWARRRDGADLRRSRDGRGRARHR